MEDREIKCEGNGASEEVDVGDMRSSSSTSSGHEAVCLQIAKRSSMSSRDNDCLSKPQMMPSIAGSEKAQYDVVMDSEEGQDMVLSVGEMLTSKSYIGCGWAPNTKFSNIVNGL